MLLDQRLVQRVHRLQIFIVLSCLKRMKNDRVKLFFQQILYVHRIQRRNVGIGHNADFLTVPVAKSLQKRREH